MPRVNNVESQKHMVSKMYEVKIVLAAGSCLKNG